MHRWIRRNEGKGKRGERERGVINKDIWEKKIDRLGKKRAKPGEGENKLHRWIRRN